ncbi:hypothetical protein [Pannonibacter sp. SL95]|uniref:hypothetical protein n=1 Tax=Pannonibacter sp. SL95 TaxID=2995153 RepID=UPI002272C336|nr:hypothetical protein [Pannonibacter sp. SL95]MCY1709018.1 hypothetical protein [Pannonibacter sp. SL95]
MTETEQTELRHQLRELSRTIAHMLVGNEPVREALLQQVQLLNEAWTMPAAEPQPGRGFDLRPTRLRLLACAAGPAKRRRRRRGDGRAIQSRRHPRRRKRHPQRRPRARPHPKGVTPMTPIPQMHPIAPAEKQHPCPGDWNWWASYDGGENLAIGPAKSRDDLVRMLRSDRGGEYQDDQGGWRLKAHIGEYRDNNQNLAEWLDIDDMIAFAAERMDDNDCGTVEGLPHPIDEISPDQESELKAAIRATVHDWQKRHRLALRCWQFTESRNCETLDIPVEITTPTE